MKKFKEGSAIINTSLQHYDIDKAAFLEMLGDNQARPLYLLIAEKPSPISELKRRSGIPSTTTYRKITWLLEKGLIRGLVKSKSQYYEILFYTIIKNAVINFSKEKGLTTEMNLEVEQ